MIFHVDPLSSQADPTHEVLSSGGPEPPRVEEPLRRDASKIEFIDENNPIVTKVNGLIDQAKT